jgi:hypothetical protein
MARLSTLNPWSALRASDKAIHDINKKGQGYRAGQLTLHAPVFVRIAKKHNEFVRRKCTQISNWENLGETFLESLCLKQSTFPKDRI